MNKDVYVLVTSYVVYAFRASLKLVRRCTGVCVLNATDGDKPRTTHSAGHAQLMLNGGSVLRYGCGVSLRPT